MQLIVINRLTAPMKSNAIKLHNRLLVFKSTLNTTIVLLLRGSRNGDVTYGSAEAGPDTKENSYF